ncbi:MAG: hypothetical protein JOY90_16655 [Bradyrhizobium sp.]|uniref:hypothetical protein n=1 Tax=Bradyrhizobium sp. TaxID=376 RepID=UPI001E0E4000|nr:hypothetical protein [Bradyrhizobium sp.]MBV9562054.1 hypothetical protein [Bradyrhizobium sp.]
MMALSKRMLEQEPSDVELLLPWHAAGTLNPRDARRVEEALVRDAVLARQYAVIREEYAETIGLNESLGAPSARAMQKLFAAIDAEPAQGRRSTVSLSSRIAGFFAGLSPRTLAWSAGVGALLLVLQAGVIGVGLLKQQSGSFQTASLEPPAASEQGPVTRGFVMGEPPRALVRFAPDARIADITTLLDAYHASIIDGAKGGMFRLQFGTTAMSQDEVANLMGRLQHEKIVTLALATP